jgi:hypothetical protein
MKTICVKKNIKEGFNQTVKSCLLLDRKSVRLGEYDTDNDGQDCDPADLNDCTDPAIQIPIEEIIVHPEYSGSATNNWNDIALLRLDRTIDYTGKSFTSMAAHLRISNKYGSLTRNKFRIESVIILK